MTRILFASRQAGESLQHLSSWLRAHGHTLLPPGGVPGEVPDPELVLLRTHGPEDAYLALACAAAWQQVGVPVVNSPAAHLIMQDKRACQELLMRAGVPQPQRLDAETPSQWPVVLKPAFGSQGRDVHLCHTPGELQRRQHQLADEPLVVQAYVPARTVRVVASAQRALLAYAKEPPPGAPAPVASISRGAASVLLEPVPVPAAELAVRAVQVVGAQLAGVDLLLPDFGSPLVLELNPSFRIPVELPGAIQAIGAGLLEYTAAR